MTGCFPLSSRRCSLTLHVARVFALLFLGLAACSDDDDDTADAGAGDGDGDADGGEVPVACGNRIVEGDEECEGVVGCAAGEACTASCTCEARASRPPTSQDLIERDLAEGTIDYATSLMYRVWALFSAPELPEAYDGEGSSGEDNYLFLELSNVRGSLPDEVEQAIAPYLARPDDPASIWSQSFAEIGGGPQAETPRCPANAQGQADWRSNGTEHFVVWSCGGGVNGPDDLASARDVTGRILEQAWTAMVGTLPEPHPDNFPNGPDPRGRIDAYILKPNECRWRNNRCVTIPSTALAAAVVATPCGSAGGGPLTSSGYILVDAAKVPAAAPSLATPSAFRYTAAHELFHVISYGMNLEAQGGTCVPRPQLPEEPLRSWLTEASAEWAPFVFFPDDAPFRRTGWFSDFQRFRDNATTGLHATDEDHEYEAFMYPFFVQEESGLLMFDVWIDSQGARTREGLDDRLNALFPFGDHFRDFSVRNFNRDLPGSPIPDAHSGFDDALPFGGTDYESWIVQPPLTLTAPITDLGLPLSIAPLAMQTELVRVRPEARSVRIDATALGAAGHLSLDALVKVNGEWSRRRLGAPLLEFCRDDEVDDIDELYLIFSNFDHHRGAKIDGDALVTTRTSCPGGWSGTIRYVMTLEDHYVDAQPAGTTVYDRSERDEQLWTVTGTRLVRPPGAPEGYEIETVDTSWHGSLINSLSTSFTDEDCGTSTTTEGGSGSGDSNTPFSVAPMGPGRYALQPTTAPYSYDVTIDVQHDPCEGPSSSKSRIQQVLEAHTIVLSIPELAQLVEDPADPGHFHGTGTFTHDVLPEPGGGESVFDISAEWDLRRTPLE